MKLKHKNGDKDFDEWLEQNHPEMIHPDAELAALRAERDELLDELKWAWDNLAKSEPYPDEECEYDRCTVCRCPDWKHSETCQLKEREAVARAILAKYSGKED